MAHNLKSEMRPLDTIHPYVNNPRRNEKAIKDVATSIRKYEFQQPTENNLSVKFDFDTNN